MNLIRIYCDAAPRFLRDAAEAPEMVRLKGVGMHCGCEYTSFPRFARLASYSRFDHSVGAALIVWRFTHSRRQTLAALYHDIATPCFAHVVDFMLGDSLRQERTEDGTREIIEASEAIGRLLDREGLTVDDVCDYHRYPVADNDSPRLSSDRLEYTLHNLVNFSLATEGEVQALYDDLTVDRGEDGQPELSFKTLAAARAFAFGALSMSRVYVSDEDRFSMQALSELLTDAVQHGAIDYGDLWTTESALIQKLKRNPDCDRAWRTYRAYSAVRRDPSGRVVYAKKRCIDPLIAGEGRLTALDGDYAAALDAFLREDQSEGLVGMADRV